DFGFVVASTIAVAISLAVRRVSGMPLRHAEVLAQGHHASRARPAGTPHPRAAPDRAYQGAAQAPGRRITDVSTSRTRPAGPAASTAAGPADRRPGRLGPGDLLAIAGLVVVAAAIEVFLRHLLSRP